MKSKSVIKQLCLLPFDIKSSVNSKFFQFLNLLKLFYNEHKNLQVHIYKRLLVESFENELFLLILIFHQNFSLLNMAQYQSILPSFLQKLNYVVCASLSPFKNKRPTLKMCKPFLKIAILVLSKRIQSHKYLHPDRLSVKSLIAHEY